MTDTIEQAARVMWDARRSRIQGLSYPEWNEADEYVRVEYRAIAQALHDAGLLAGGWRPIEEAPKDGTEFMAWVWHSEPDDGGYAISDCKWDEKYGWFSVTEGMCAPTHFMPLPTPPEGNNKEADHD